MKNKILEKLIEEENQFLESVEEADYDEMCELDYDEDDEDDDDYEEDDEQVLDDLSKKG